MPSIKFSQLHLNESIREVDKSSWLISNTLLLTRSSAPVLDKIPTDQAYWSDSNGGHFILSTAPGLLPDSKPFAEDSLSISRVHAVDNQAAVWRAGEAFIKAHHKDYSHGLESILPYSFSKTKSPGALNFYACIGILRLARDISSSSRGFRASSLRKLGLTWTRLFASITSAR